MKKTLIINVVFVILCNSLKHEIKFKVKPFNDNKGHFVCLVLGLCTGNVFSHFGREKLSLEYQWKFLEYAYDTPYQKQGDLRSGNLVPRKPAPIDVDVWYNRNNGRRTVFVTSPRFQAGVPASLGTVVLDNYNKPYVKPYPSWEWYKEPKQCRPNRIVSVFRTVVDECDRLWVLDNGQLDAGVICPPQVLAFDLKTNQLIHKYELPRDQYQNQSTFVTPVVDILSKENGCKNTFLYLADCAAYSIVVYDAANRKSWKTQHYTMFPNPDWAVYTIRGESFDLMDGVLGMSLSNYLPGEGRKLFYHAMSSDTENWVYTRDLQNPQRSQNSSIFHTYKGRRGTQSAAEAVDREGIMYFGLMSEINIACFNTQRQYGRNCSSTDIVASNPETLQFASGIKVINAPNGRQELWILTSRFQKVANDAIKDNEYNFRILVGDTQDLKMGTRCQSGFSNPDGSYNGPPVIFPENKKKK